MNMNRYSDANLQKWCKLKILLWNKESKIIFKQRDIWWCSLGINLGEEMFGKGEKFTRPVLIFRKFTKNSFLGLPITKQEKIGSWYVEITMHREKRWVMLNQARILDKKRLTNRIGVLDDEDFKKVRDRFIEFYSGF
jgi:mRNA-degrading endonuclease toxin of MazEF toxin-antitoxin module